MDLFFQVGKRGVCPGSWQMQFEPAVRETMGEKLSQLCPERGGIPGHLWVAKDGGYFASGREVDQDGLRLFPVRRYLQDGRAAQATVRDQHLFTEVLSHAGGNHFGGNARKITVAGPMLGGQEQRHQAGPRIADGESELPRQIIAEGCRADLWNRKASGGNHQRWRAEFGI